ncbi:hypothetical protein [Streptomyces sp. NPDC002403]
MDSVFLLHPEDVVFGAMLDGWGKQQRGRRLDPDTIAERVRLVRRFMEFSEHYLRRWTAVHMDEWSFSLTAEQGHDDVRVGLRCREVSRLDLTDFHRNPKAPELGRYGQVHVPYGKASKGSGPRRRMVAGVMPWAVESMEDYLVNIRPRFKHHSNRKAV